MFLCLIALRCRSFAYYTVKVRMPVILTQTLDRLVREKNDIGRCFGPVTVGNMFKARRFQTVLIAGSARGIEGYYWGNFKIEI